VGQPAGIDELLDLLPARRRREALTHRAWAGPGRPSYERLEFLGDSVLQLIATDELMRRHPDASEGELTAMRQPIVSGRTCARLAADAGLGERMRAEAPARARAAAREIAPRERVLAALAEAVIGAAWRELPAEIVASAVTAALEPELSGAEPGRRDAKTALQEHAARRGLATAYRHLEPEGPPHDRVFTALALLDGRERGRGRGTSKQAAEREAAAAALAAEGVEAC